MSEDSPARPNATSSGSPSANRLSRLLEGRFGDPGNRETTLELPDSLASILARRTHRRYLERDIPEELLDTLLACAFSAPAKSDLQQASVVRVRDPSKRKAIAELIPTMPWIAKAPVFLVFLADHRRIRRVCELRGLPFENDNLDGFLNASVDAALVMQTFILAAESIGLGCCAISVLRNHIETVSDLLELPPSVYPLAGLCVGYPSQEGFVSMRLPRTLTVHTDRYDDSDLEAEIEAYDRRRDARYSIPRESYKSTERHGVPDFYGWSEDKARQESNPERANFSSFLKNRGFTLK